MKSILKCVLSLFILFSTVDLSMINLFGSLCPNTEKMTSISELVKIEYDLFYQSKSVVTKVCNNIAKDVVSLLTPVKVNKTFFEIDKSERKLCVDNYFNYLKFVLVLFVSKTVYILKKTEVPLLFFGFIFIFMLKYLGLLFTFSNIIIYKQYRKAYSM